MVTRCSGRCTWVTPSVGNINYGRCCVEAPQCKIILKTVHPNYKLLLRPKPYTTIININVCDITYIYDHFHIVCQLLCVISRYSWLFMGIHVIKPIGKQHSLLGHCWKLSGLLLTKFNRLLDLVLVLDLSMLRD